MIESPVNAIEPLDDVTYGSETFVRSVEDNEKSDVNSEIEPRFIERRSFSVNVPPSAELYIVVYAPPMKRLNGGLIFSTNKSENVPTYVMPDPEKDEGTLDV